MWLSEIHIQRDKLWFFQSCIQSDGVKTTQWYEGQGSFLGGGGLKKEKKGDLSPQMATSEIALFNIWDSYA